MRRGSHLYVEPLYEVRVGRRQNPTKWEYGWRVAFAAGRSKSPLGGVLPLRLDVEGFTTKPLMVPMPYRPLWPICGDRDPSPKSAAWADMPRQPNTTGCRICPVTKPASVAVLPRHPKATHGSYLPRHRRAQSRPIGRVWSGGSGPARRSHIEPQPHPWSRRTGRAARRCASNELRKKWSPRSRAVVGDPVRVEARRRAAGRADQRGERVDQLGASLN
jgi:hypothetical protein